jgi:hypothetical protein
MNKIMLPIAALVTLSIGLVIASMVYIHTTKSPDIQPREDEKSAQHSYDMPKFVPAVWLRGH